MGKQIKSILYRTFHSRMIVIVLLVGLVLSLFVTFPGDLYNTQRLEKRMQTDDLILKRIRNAFKLGKTETVEEIMELIEIRNFSVAVGNTNAFALIFSIFVTATFFNRSFNKKSLSYDILHSSKTKITAAYLIVLHAVCSLCFVCVLSGAIIYWVNWREIPVSVIIRNICFSLIIVSAHTSFLALIACLTRKASIGAAASIFIIIVMKYVLKRETVETVIPLGKTVIYKAWDIAAPTSEYIPMLLLSLAYTVVFTSLTFIAAKRIKSVGL